EAGQPEERAGGQVLAADRGRVPHGAHGPRRDEEVARGARDPQAVEPDEAGRDQEQRDAHEGQCGAHGAPPSSGPAAPSASAAYRRSLRAAVTANTTPNATITG